MTAMNLIKVAESGETAPFDWIYLRGQEELRNLFGGSPRIHAGELGFQAERLA